MKQVAGPAASRQGPPTRRPGAATIAGALLAGLLAAPGAPWAQDLKRPEEQLAAIYALRTQLDIEQRRLDTALQRHTDNVRAREEARDRLTRLYTELDGMVSGRATAAPDAIAAREEDVSKAEAQMEAVIREGRQIRIEIRGTRHYSDIP